jgi:flagellar motor switch protein FliM
MLQQSDINVLLNTLAAAQHQDGKGGSGKFSEVKLYDFARPDNIPSEFVRALENINSAFARAMVGVLTSYLSFSVSVEPLSIDQMTFRQFCREVPESTALALINIAPIEGTALLELNPHIAWNLIDRGLGGKGEMMDAPRDFSVTEKGLLEDYFRRVLREFGRAWNTLVPMHPALREVMTNVMLTRIAQPDDRMVVCSFSINYQDVTGMSTYCIPASNLDFERLLNREESWDDTERIEMSQEMVQEIITHNLQNVPISLRNCLPDITISLGELSSMSPGDVINLGTKVDEPTEVRMGDIKVFHARPVTKDEFMAMEILDPIKGE